MKNKKILGILIITMIITILLAMTNITFASEGPILDLDNIGNEESNDDTSGDDEDPEDLSSQIQKPNAPENNDEIGAGNDGAVDDGNNNPSDGQEKEESEEDFPYTGPETSIAIIVAFVSCAAIAGYAFIKLSDYNNI